MRDDFNALYDKINNKDFDGNLSKIDFTQLTVGSLIISSQLNDRINSLKKALAGYQTEIIPQLQEIVEKAENDEEAMKIADEKFTIKSNE